LGQRGAVVTMYMVGAVSGALALLVGTSPLSFAIVAIPFALLLALAGVVYLERAPYERQARAPVPD